MLRLLVLAVDAGPNIDLSAIAPGLSMVGSLGFSIWFGWYMTSVSIPKLIESHRQERREMQERFDTSVHELLNEMKEERRQYADLKAQLMADKLRIT